MSKKRPGRTRPHTRPRQAKKNTGEGGWSEWLSVFKNPQTLGAAVKRAVDFLGDVKTGVDPIEAMHGHVCSPTCWHSVLGQAWDRKQQEDWDKKRGDNPEKVFSKE